MILSITRRLVPSQEKTLPLKENEFFPAPGGHAGTVNYQAPLNTHSSPDVIQDPEKFVDPNANKAMGKSGNTAKDTPAQPIDMQKAIDQIYAKKTVPTADQVKAGLDYELHNMIKPDKAKAKELVLQNLRRDPNYYGALHMLNIDDKHMKVDLKEGSVNISETKKIFAEMAKQKDEKYVVNSGIVDVMKKMWAQKQARRAWLSGGTKSI